MSPTDVQTEVVTAIRDLTLQLMLISAGVFGIVGGFVSASNKEFTHRCLLAIALILFAFCTVLGYALHGVLISLLSANEFDPFNNLLVWLGVLQILTFVLGGFFFTFFVITNVQGNRQ